MKRSNLIPSAIFALFSVIFCSCGSSPEFRQESGVIWHTSYHVTYNCDRDLSDSILLTLNNVGASLNVFDDNSAVSRINAATAGYADSHLKRIYSESLKIHRLTGGAFDPTLGPLITAWGFGKGHQATADTLRLDSLLSITGLTKTTLRGDTIYKDDRRIQFNFSAIAKGYGCDCVGAMFRRNGVQDFLVEIGGEICASGKSPSGEDWRVSVDRPDYDNLNHESQAVVSFTDMGMATSGNYRNYHESGSGRYGHTISARSGRPVKTDVLSATVLAATAMEADALATSFMAMGSAEAEKLAERLRLPVMLVLSDQSVWQSEKFKAICAEASEPGRKARN